jgi:uncharacterized membrane protein
MQKLLSLWDSLRTSLWFMPTLLVVAGVALALLLIEANGRLGADSLAKDWPRLFGAGAEGARSMLSAIATSMITVAGVAFSITVVALTLASAQYSSRILRTFLRDRANQAVLGILMGVFAYCLVVLRTIRGGDEGAFVPTLAVAGGGGLAFIAIGAFIFFIHHIAASIQATNIIRAAANETLHVIDRLFPTEMGKAHESETRRPPDDMEDSDGWSTVPALRTGYIQAVDSAALLRFAAEHNTVIRMERGVGEFVAEGTSLVSLREPPRGAQSSAPEKDETHDAAQRLDSIYTIGLQRTMLQDTGFGIRQLVDVALKALSPGVNDTTTAVTCVEYLGAILARLAARHIESPYRMDEGVLRVIAKAPTFDSMLGEAFDQIRQNAGGNVAVILALTGALQGIAHRTQEPGRLESLRRQADAIAELAARTIPAAPDREKANTALERLMGRLDAVLAQATT